MPLATEAGVSVKHCTHGNVFFCFLTELPKKATAKAVRNQEKQYLESGCARRCCSDEEKTRKVVPYIPRAAAATVSHWGGD